MAVNNLSVDTLSPLSQPLNSNKVHYSILDSVLGLVLFICDSVRFGSVRNKVLESV